MTELTKLTVTEAVEGLKNKDFSSVELTKAFIDNIEKKRDLNAFITETPELALEQAKKSDERIAKGEAGRIEGIPLGVKDLFCTKGVKTTAASKMLENFVPGYESTVTRHLWEEGGVMLGKTNMDEFAMGSTNKTSYFGAVKSPFKKKGDDRDLTPGGSSGGSAAAVAADMCIAATGSDTGGSVRQPAAFTGLVGTKPSYGRCSRYGMVAFASSFDQAGILTKTVKDSALLTSIMAGPDSRDSTVARLPKPDFFSNLSSDVKGKRIGIPVEYKNVDGINPEIQKAYEKAAEALKSAGAELVEISVPNTQYCATMYTVLAYGEAYSNLSRYDGVRFTHRTDVECSSLDEMYEKTRREGFGLEVRKRITIGSHFMTSENYHKLYLQSQKIRRIISNKFAECFEKVDAILAPTTPIEPFAINLTPEEIASDITSNYLNDFFAIPANVAGLCATSVPVGLSSNGLPMGVQVIANKFDEQNMFDVSLALEKALK